MGFRGGILHGAVAPTIPGFLGKPLVVLGPAIRGAVFQRVEDALPR